VSQITSKSSILGLQHLICFRRDQDPVWLGALLSGVRSIEDIRELLKSPLACFDSKEVDENGLYKIPARQDDISMPFNDFHGIPDSELVYEQSDVSEDGVYSHSFSAGLVCQALDRIHGLQWRPAKAEGKAYEEDDHN
jgi:hypothetical protein